jgi:hypothetical protein
MAVVLLRLRRDRSGRKAPGFDLERKMVDRGDGAELSGDVLDGETT